MIAIDTSPVRLALARHNAVIYGVADRIEFILADFISFARSYISQAGPVRRRIDVVFLSPPWGGPEYLSGSSSKELSHDISGGSEEGHAEYSLAGIKPIHGADLFRLSRSITPNVAYFLPRNSSLEEISGLVDDERRQSDSTENTKEEMDKVEEECMGSKLKALTCYFGGLVAGQEDMFDS